VSLECRLINPYLIYNVRTQENPEFDSARQILKAHAGIHSEAHGLLRNHGPARGSEGKVCVIVCVMSVQY